jgi:hypothetical protein
MMSPNEPGAVRGRLSEEPMPKTSLGRSRLLKPNIGLGSILAQSDTVVRAFGRDRGFLLMLIALGR